MTTNLSLYELAENYRKIEELEETPEELEVYLDAISEQVDSKIDSIVKFRQNLTSTAVAIQNEIDRLTAMKKSRESLSMHLKDYVARVMTLNGIKKIETDLFKLSFLKSTAVVVDDSTLDEKYIITKITKQADKVALKKALQAGEVIQGATLEERQNLQIK